ncbi:MAG: flagellar brake protein [Eubacterium sp.]|nr:flagellar brake protein [Eubacterium sp.]
MNEKIRIGDRIELQHIKSAARTKLSDKIYRSQLLDYDGNVTLRIAMPIYEGKIIPLEIGDEYEITFLSSRGINLSRGTIIRRFKEGTTYLLEVRLDTDIVKNQRRQFYRLDYMMEMRFRIVTEPEEVLRYRLKMDNFNSIADKIECEEQIEKIEKIWIDAMLSDISGGGGRFQCAADVKPQSTIEVEIPLGSMVGDKVFRSFARVIADEYIPDSTRDYEIRCEFESLENRKQEEVIKFIFDEQKRRLKK